MTEITWEGKYKDGKKVAPIRIALPFQTIETVNESAADRQERINSLFSQKEEKTNDYNRLIWGDKKYVLPSLLSEFAGKVKLIYIDPPFDTGANFSFSTTIPQHEDEDESISLTKQPSIIEQKAYRDTWGKGLDSYLQWFYETVVLLRELLAEDGSIYVHLDSTIGHYAKCILDEVFGYNNFVNDIIWRYKKFAASGQGFSRNHDLIFLYRKGEKIIYNELRIPVDNKRKQTARVWDSKLKKAIQKKDEAGNLIYYDQVDKKVDDVWDDIQIVNPMAVERLGYPTQKPEQLLERIITTSSNEGDLVLDCFCGSGTTAVTAEKLKRKWITCDLGRFAIHTARKRLLGITGITPFLVQNLGKYERQQWIKAEFNTPEQLAQRIAQEQAYRKFIIDLYHGQVLAGTYLYLHGVKAGRMIHIGSVDSPITTEDVKQAILEFWKAVGKENAIKQNGIDFLGWEFAFDINETASQMAAENKVSVKFKKIPREVLEKKAIEQGDIRFYELAALSTKVSIKKREVTITLDNFMLPPDEIPAETQAKITHWSQWVDYWAIDWNYQTDTFHNEWQSYRTKQNPKIELTAKQSYEEKGTYTVLIKVVDILGNDTTKVLEIGIE